MNLILNKNTPRKRLIMKFPINGTIKDISCVWLEGTSVGFINQSILPFREEIYYSHTVEETAEAIRTMIVRGAPAIGATAAYGLAQCALLHSTSSLDSLCSEINDAIKLLLSTRPTAVDLKHGLDIVYKAINDTNSVEEAKKRAVAAAKDFAAQIIEEGRKIGEQGLQILREEGIRILTHCNTGPLAFVDYGSALAPILLAHKKGLNIFVWVDETRPRLQGARLTAYELAKAGVRHAIIADNTAGYLMYRQEVDVVIFGADRVAENGDVANKIGSYSLAILANYHGIPVYSAFPRSTFDPNTKTGEDIEIERRSEIEVTTVLTQNANKKIIRVPISNPDSPAVNYAFDIVPFHLITGYITPIGILEASELKNLTKL